MTSRPPSSCTEAAPVSGCRFRTRGTGIRHAGAVQPGPTNAITDVPGIRVGHATRQDRGWLTGVTVVVPPSGTVGGVEMRGGAPGTRETDLLAPRNLVTSVDAVVLAGGSAFGLAAADGVVAEVHAAGRGWPVGPEPHERVPIVPAAILFDLGRGGPWLHHPSAADGAAAYRAATEGDGRVVEGSVGAATGARSGGLRGGVGTASAVLPCGVTVGAVVVVNAAGSAVAGDGTLLGAEILAEAESLVLPTPDPALAAAHQALRAAEVEALRDGSAGGLRPGTATTLAVVATDATRTKAGCESLAGAAHDGFARALSPVHTAFDGDAVFTLATGAGPALTGIDEVELQTAAADCVTRAIVHAVLVATSVDRTADGGVALLSYVDAVVAQPRVE